MDFFMKPALTFWLFGGIDVSWLAIVLVALGVAAAVVVAVLGKKKEMPSRKRKGIVAAILLAVLAGSCALSVLTDGTPAVETEEWVTLFGVTLPINREAFTLNIGEGYSVYWYGILIAAGFLLALWYGFRKAPAFGVDKDRMMDVILVGMVAGVLCARAYYLIFDGKPLNSFGEFFAIHDGGLAIYGGVIGALIFGGLACKLRKVAFWDMFDLAALGFPIGQAVGRWGNFVNQEVYGTATGSDWFGMTGSSIGKTPVHPLFLYESLWCAGIFILLHYIGKKRRFSGQLFSLYLAIYAFGRFFLEGMRNTEFILMLGRVGVSQIVSVAAVIAGVALYFILRRRANRKPDEAYEALFGEMTVDPEKEAAAYELLGCEWDASDEEVDAAYAAARAPFEAMETETDEQRAKVNDKLEELAAAYDFIKQARAAEAGDAPQSEESEAE